MGNDLTFSLLTPSSRKLSEAELEIKELEKLCDQRDEKIDEQAAELERTAEALRLAKKGKQHRENHVSILLKEKERLHQQIHELSIQLKVATCRRPLRSRAGAGAGSGVGADAAIAEDGGNDAGGFMSRGAVRIPTSSTTSTGISISPKAVKKRRAKMRAADLHLALERKDEAIAQLERKIEDAERKNRELVVRLRNSSSRR